MSDIIADINKRIADAEAARDAALAEVEALKTVIKKNHIVLHDGVAYMFVGSGICNGFHCAKCPFNEMTSPDTARCIIHRDDCKCYEAGGRYYSIAELKRSFKEKLKKEDEDGFLEEKISCLQDALEEISRIATEARKNDAS